MSAFDIAVIASAALAGWLLVSWLFTLGKPRNLDHPGTLAAETSVADLGEQWHDILGVAEDSGIELIEARFREAVADCDRIRSSGLSSSAEVAAAETRRQAVTAAYEFILSVKRTKEPQRLA